MWFYDIAATKIWHLGDNWIHEIYGSIIIF